MNFVKKEPDLFSPLLKYVFVLLLQKNKNMRIKNFRQDNNNFNRHTEKGLTELKSSIETVGVIESFTVSNDDKIISGNARQKKMSEVFGEEVEPIIVETDGSRPVVLKRTDITSDTKKFYEAALLANTVSKNNMNLDEKLIKEIAVNQFSIKVEDINYSETNIKIESNHKIINTIPFHRTHILISFPPEKLIDIQHLLNEIKTKEFVEYEQSSN